MIEKLKLLSNVGKGQMPDSFEMIKYIFNDITHAIQIVVHLQALYSEVAPM